jgi:hypothetical protein
MRELVTAVAIFLIALVLIPLLVAAVARQSGQAMFWPAYQALYTYFLRYTLAAVAAVTILVELIRLVIYRLRRGQS